MPAGQYMTHQNLVIKRIGKLVLTDETLYCMATLALTGLHVGQHGLLRQSYIIFKITFEICA